MKIRLFFTSVFSLLWICSFGQTNDTLKSGTTLTSVPTEKENVKDSSWHYEPNFSIGFDVLHLGFSFFTDQKMYQGFISSRLTQKLHAVADVGFEKNIYDKNGYDVKANGIFGKLGVLYMMMPDPENVENGFYIGGKLAASFYNQEMKAIPIRWIQGKDSFASFPKSSQSAYWIEATIGGRVEILGSRLFIDVQAQPKYLLYSTKQEDIKPMVIPGFGKDAGKFKIGYMWSLGFRF